MKTFAYLVMVTIIVAFFGMKTRRSRICKFGYDHVTISTVTTGMFSQTIPQTGTAINDSIVAVPIDELYLTRIKIGMDGITTYDNNDIPLQIIEIDSAVVDGRFSVRMKSNKTDRILKSGTRIRLRISLSKPQYGTLLPLGGFYKDTGGGWVFVTKDGEHFEKRMVKLGPRNPENFLVLDGLKPGELVLTSSYEGFIDRSSFTRWELNVRKPLSLM